MCCYYSRPTAKPALSLSPGSPLPSAHPGIFVCARRNIIAELYSNEYVGTGSPAGLIRPFFGVVPPNESETLQHFYGSPTVKPVASRQRGFAAELGRSVRAGDICARKRVTRMLLVSAAMGHQERTHKPAWTRLSASPQAATTKTSPHQGRNGGGMTTYPARGCDALSLGKCVGWVAVREWGGKTYE